MVGTAGSGTPYRRPGADLLDTGADLGTGRPARALGDGRRRTALATAALVLLAGGATARAAGPGGPPGEVLVQRGEVVRVGVLDADGRAALQVRSRSGERTYLLGAGTLVDDVRGGLDRLVPGDRVTVVAEAAGPVTRVIERPRRSWRTGSPPEPPVRWLTPPGAVQP